ncbi:terminase [Hungatella sp. L12]|uniref:Terminase n=1 Tax=Hungatella hominis TaxID=2763050 RepID=A0ABR7HCS7_9FIRM|nr:phage terminase small subunit [Hungatella hominis]MBC5710989.1 terminase [Hungatella hominis]
MARAPDARYEQAKAMFLNGQKLVEIASQLNLPEGTVRRWKSTHRWDSERSDKKSERSHRKRGAPLGNNNAVGHGAPEQNKNAEKYGFFSKYLPEETVSIIQEMPKDPLDVLWDQIQIAYAAIIRAQKIMYVRDREDSTKTEVGHKDGDMVTEERWEVQQAWDKQGNFLQAQARAQAELRSMIKQYDELLHKRWDLATEEQRARIAVLKSQVEKDEEKPIRIEFKKAGENYA